MSLLLTRGLPRRRLGLRRLGFFVRLDDMPGNPAPSGQLKAVLECPLPDEARLALTAGAIARRGASPLPATGTTRRCDVLLKCLAKFLRVRVTEVDLEL